MLELSHTASGRTQMVQPLWQFLLKVNRHLSHHTTILLFGIYTREMKPISTRRDLYVNGPNYLVCSHEKPETTQMAINWCNQLCTIQYYIAVKCNEQVWMNLKRILLESTQKATYCITSFIIRHTRKGKTTTSVVVASSYGHESQLQGELMVVMELFFILIGVVVCILCQNSSN